MPYFLLDGASIYDRLRAPTFHLSVFTDGSTEKIVIADDLESGADVHTISLYPHIADIFGTGDPFCVLLRPDNYIGYIASGVNIDRVKEYLRKYYPDFAG